MAWTFPLTARELGELSSKISVEIFKQRGIPCPAASLIVWKGDCCIKTPAEMNGIILPNVIELYSLIYADEQRRKQLIGRAEDFGVTISVGSGYTEFVKTRIYNLTLLNSILGRCAENGVNEFTWAHWPNYEDRNAGKKGIDLIFYNEFSIEHTNQIHLEQKRLIGSINIAA